MNCERAYKYEIIYNKKHQKKRMINNLLIL